MTAAKTTSELRIRNTGLRRVRVADLADAPWNHRTHPHAQQAALDGAIEELGFYGFPDVFEAADGTLMLIDGHLRKERLIARYGADAEIEVNVTDFDEAEAKKANLTKDPLAAMAEENAAVLDKLLRDCETGDAALQEMLAELADKAGLYKGGGDVALLHRPIKARELNSVLACLGIRNDCSEFVPGGLARDEHCGLACAEINFMRHNHCSCEAVKDFDSRLISANHSVNATHPPRWHKSIATWLGGIPDTSHGTPCLPMTTDTNYFAEYVRI